MHRIVLLILVFLLVACTGTAGTPSATPENAAPENAVETIPAPETSVPEVGTPEVVTPEVVTPEVGLRIGDIAPDFETVLEDGTPVALSDYRGQVVLLNFWATWCGPCRVEMPEFQAQYEARQDQGFVILAVNNQETVDEVLDFKTEFELSFPLLMDETGRINERFALFAYPSTFLLDRDGVILARHFGPLTSSQIEEMLADAL